MILQLANEIGAQMNLDKTRTVKRQLISQNQNYMLSYLGAGPSRGACEQCAGTGSMIFRGLKSYEWYQLTVITTVVCYQEHAN
jgi:hypothetical protein